MIVWQFETAQFCIQLHIEPEDMDPADYIGEGEDLVNDIREGRCEWFQATVRVLKNGHEIGRDHLGGCSYNSFREFYTSHREADEINRNCSLMRKARGDIVICHYFPSMVREAIEDARNTLHIHGAQS
jgi:hypothetical protein